MTINTIETLILTCVFILPGFIIDGIVDIFCPQGKKKDWMHFLFCLVYSVIHCAIFSWLYILEWKIKDNNLSLFLFIICLTSLVMSTIIGIVIGLFKSKQWIRKIFCKINKNAKNAIPTAWDYVFFTQNVSVYVIVTLKDDSKIYGYYGMRSYSSSDDEERDLYLEHIYHVEEDGTWTLQDDDGGILILPSQIKIIEFLKENTNE